MATTCNFGQVKDLRLKSMCMGDITIIDPNRNIYGNTLYASENIISTCNIEAGKTITSQGDIRGENIISNCVNQNSIKVKFATQGSMTIPENENTIITWQGLEYGYTTSGISWDGNTKINISKDGVYHIEATIDWEQASDGYFTMYILVNGIIAGSGNSTEVRNYINVVQNCSCDIALKTDDYVEIQVFHSGTGDNLQINPLNLSHMSVRYIHETTSNEYPTISTLRELSEEDAELAALKKEMQELRRQMASNTFTNNRNQRLRAFGNKTLAKNRLM